MGESDYFWRQSTRGEIQDYYENEFPSYVSSLPEWISTNGPNQWALAFREGYPAKRHGDTIPPRDFVRRSTRGDDGRLFIESWDEVVSFIQQPAGHDPMREGTGGSMGLMEPDLVDDQLPPVPVAVYYSLDNHERFWVLAFDIDAKDVTRKRVAKSNQSPNRVSKEQLEEAGVFDQEPTRDVLMESKGPEGNVTERHVAEYAYSFQDLQNSFELAFELKEWLESNVGFTEVRVFYSGQGAHVYAIGDEDPYLQLTYQSRKFLTTYIQERLQIPIDEQVTWDHQRVIRLPYSLHTDVSRIVVEMDSPDFDYINEPVPEFLVKSSGVSSDE